MKATLRILEPGLLSTLQDRGRHGYQRLGIPVSGALDWVSFEIANMLVGNPAGTAAIEMSFAGPALEVAAASARVALAGTSGMIEILDPGSGRPARLPALQSVRLERGTRFRIPGFGDSAVAYLAVEGGFDIASVMGSLSTHWRAQIGPLDGCRITAGEVLPLRLATAPERTEVKLVLSRQPSPNRYRVVLGPQDDKFAPAQVAAFLSSTYHVSREADRWGLRLDGPALAHAISIVSDAIAPGSIQVPAGGQPLVLLADRATTGGYPKIATVISADLPAMGRLTPGAAVIFEAVSVEVAEDARRRLEAEVQAMRGRLQPVTGGTGLDAGRLMSENLISGVIDAKGD